jgi:NTP pyrophosphatase (non-canonical NTP hydrolase)
MTITDLVRESHDRAKRKGFYDPVPSIEQRLCLIHSEVSEALEAYRDGELETTFSESGKPNGFPSELADIVIRVCDLAGHLGIDLEGEIRAKSDFNETRPAKHGRRF